MEITSKQLQWYPGHMAKATRQIREKLKLVDTIIEILDARVPIASRNPDIAQLLQKRKKTHIILLNKSDLSDTNRTEQWIGTINKEFTAQYVMSFTAYNHSDRSKLIHILQQNQSKKCLICGIPNVGKSAIINTLANKKKAITGNKPGVTKGQQWIQTEEKIMLLDTPGILWPKFDSERIGTELAWIGAIKDTIFEKENLAGEFVKFMIQYYPDRLRNRYRLGDISGKKPWEIFDMICEEKKLLARGGEYDYGRASNMLLTDIKNGKFGKITIDMPGD
ncbi:ribosome biogenesis GTPase YlqF [Pseudoramibacter porci]|uniref:Ribosome biogenesis GTPase A n=1 Tax=Pseudoramibacter porci TaxID=2606631 RepID=A0A7X2NGM3_9FIRM|nr:ribosome biogenesis GTPase YlqF [Pseudoramibacter porci]MSS20269.1 ribosome biogenesis GTPase YlqF [Pseudoramibacter porci]